MRPVIAYDIVRVCLAGVLLLAAGLKGYQLTTEPILGTGLLDSRWFLIALVEFELLFGLWLLANIRPQWTRRASIGCFAVFAAVSLYQALAGAASCGCFGRVAVNPWYTFVMDGAAVLALLRWQPKRGLSRISDGEGGLVPLPLRGPIVLVIWLLVGVLAVFAMATSQPAVLAESGIIIGDNSVVILEPERWIGKRFPLLPFIEDAPGQVQPGERPLQEQLSEGIWVVLLYHHDCPECREAIAGYEQLAASSAADANALRLALIEVPPYDETDSLRRLSNVPCALGRLSDKREWFVETLVEMTAESARVRRIRRVRNDL
ncbi:MAG: MauE/DoxX family redox-associated membrane protein [Planctomycetota bacterium]